MSRIKKGFATSTAVLGVFAFAFGLVAFIYSFNLQSTVLNLSIETNDDDILQLKFVDFWWGAIFVRFNL